MAVDIGPLQQEILNTVTTNNPLNSVSGEGIDPTQVTDPSKLFYRIISFTLWALAIVAIGIIIYGGIQYVTAGGDSEKAEKGKKTLIGAIIGLIIILASYAIYNSTVSVLSTGQLSSNLNQQEVVCEIS